MTSSLWKGIWFSDNNLSLSVCISIKLYHEISYHKMKVGIDFGCYGSPPPPPKKKFEDFHTKKKDLGRLQYFTKTLYTWLIFLDQCLEYFCPLYAESNRVFEFCVLVHIEIYLGTRIYVNREEFFEIRHPCLSRKLIS